jgi:hypothetical protein
LSLQAVKLKQINPKASLEFLGITFPFSIN